MENSNRFFLYEGEIIRAANHSLHEVLKYWFKGTKVYYGTPQSHNKDITDLAIKLTPKYWDFKTSCLKEEAQLTIE